MKFLFDLDGTVTAEETLPIIAQIGGVESSINELTKRTIEGDVPFIESFVQRVNILKDIPVSLISNRLAMVRLYDSIFDFIQSHQDQCAIVTGNLSCWCDALNKRIGCTAFSSEAEVKDDHVVKIKSILLKERVVDNFKNNGETVCFIGDGNNDLEAMRHADISIAAGMSHAPARSLYSICDYVVFNEKALCRQLNQLL